VEGDEEISVPMGRRRALRVSGTSRGLTASLAEDPAVEPRRFIYWFSADAERIPLRVVSTTAYGKVEMRASSYTAPSDRRSSSAMTTAPTSVGN
jgi:hypothetical protein